VAEELTQCERLLTYLRERGEVTSLGIVLDLRIINTTGRISDLRAQGHDIVGTRDEGGAWYYRLREARPAAVAGQVGMFD
jgi:hypothetical protein